MFTYLTQTQQSGLMALLPSILMFAVMGLAFYFMLIKPQKKQQERHREMMDNLKVGDNIITRGGIRGKIVKITADSFIIKTADSTMEILKQGLNYVENEVQSQGSFTSNEPVGNLSYGNNEKFIEALEKQKKLKNLDIEYDVLLEDIYEFVVVENSANGDLVSNRFRLPIARAEEILNQLQLLEIVSESDEDNNRKVLLDPR